MKKKNGIGGSADYEMYLAKEAIARPIGTKNPDPHVAKLEEELFELLNETFFVQAEDGIRVRTVTGVQTCALPISARAPCVRSAAARAPTTRPRSPRARK